MVRPEPQGGALLYWGEERSPLSPASLGLVGTHAALGGRWRSFRDVVACPVVSSVTSWTPEGSIWSAPFRNVKGNGLIGGLDRQEVASLSICTEVTRARCGRTVEGSEPGCIRLIN